MPGRRESISEDGMIRFFMKESEKEKKRSGGRRGARAPSSVLLPSGLEMTD